MAGKTIYSDHKMSIIYPIQSITVQRASLQNWKISYTNVTATNSGNTWHFISGSKLLIGKNSDFSCNVILSLKKFKVKASTSYKNSKAVKTKRTEIRKLR